jgi:endonuclease/exonuclease/phosphatase family metal-dependent hydrolase
VLRRLWPGLVLIVVVVPTLVRLIGDHGRVPLVGLAALAPYSAALVVAALALLVWLRRWRLVVLAALAAAVNLVWLAPLWTADPPPSAGSPLTVMTANLALGEADPAALVNAVRTHRVDVLAVEELTDAEVGRLRRAGLEETLGYHQLSPQPGASGSGLWSRRPLSRLASWDSFFAMPAASVEVGGRWVVLHVVHAFPTLLSGSQGFRSDYAVLTRRVGNLDPASPAVILGDFNASLDHAELRTLMGDRFRDAPEIAGAGLLRTWSPSRHLPPLLHLDHVLVDRHFGVRDVTVVDIPGSDHRAVVAELVLRQTG